MANHTDHATLSLRTPRLVWILFFAAAVLLCVGFSSSLRLMLSDWLDREEYSHALLIPLITGYLIWQQREVLSRIEFRPAWGGLLITVLGGAVHLMGQLSAIFTLSQCGLLICVYGLVLSFVGWSVFKRIAGPLLILALMIPLPEFLLQNMSADLQLLSSRIGVAFMRVFGVSVFLQGNVIDLGSYKLQVAEACDGLRYLFPLMTLSILMAYLFRAALWKRITIFASSIPISILMNSVRVGIIGILVEHWGAGMAEGFVHQFQGWVVFMISFALLIFEMILLARVGRDKGNWKKLFGMLAPTHAQVAPAQPRRIPVSLYGSFATVLLIAIVSVVLPRRVESVPPHRALSEFPNALGVWSARREAIDRAYMDALNLDDYVLADYTERGAPPINLYVAWYDSQHAGRSAHSPRSCLPGGGWEIANFRQEAISSAAVNGVPLHVNRVLIRYGNQHQLVYYWFQQRGRVVTNEYLVKWYLFWDSLVRNRSDGALVRVSIPLGGNHSEASAERELASFVREIAPRLDSYIPD